MIDVRITVRGGPSADYANDPRLLDLIAGVVPARTYTLKSGNSGNEDPFVDEDARFFEDTIYSFANAGPGGAVIENIFIDGRFRIAGDTTTVLSGTLLGFTIALPNGVKADVRFDNPDAISSFGLPLSGSQSIGTLIEAAGGIGSIVFTAGNDTNLGLPPGIAFDGVDTDDTLFGNRGDDTLAGGKGSDFVQAVDTLDIPGFPGGEIRSDALYGGERFAIIDAFGLDFATGDATEDTPVNTLVGGPGQDDLFGVSQDEYAVDFLIGGPGLDHFYVDNRDVIEEFGKYVPDTDTQEALEAGEIIDYYITEKSVDSPTVNVLVDEEENFIKIFIFNAVGRGEGSDVESGLLGGFFIEKGNLQEDLFDVSVIPLDGNKEGNVEAVLRFEYGEFGNFLGPSLSERFNELASYAALQERVIDEGSDAIAKAVASYLRSAVENPVSKLTGDEAATVISRIVFEVLAPKTLPDNLVAQRVAEALSSDPNVLASIDAFNNEIGRAYTDLQDPLAVALTDPKNADPGAGPSITIEALVADALARASDEAAKFLDQEASGLVPVSTLKLGAEIVAAVWIGYAEAAQNQRIFETQNATVFSVPVAENETGGQSYFIGDAPEGPSAQKAPQTSLGSTSLSLNSSQESVALNINAPADTPGTSSLDRVFTDRDFDLAGTAVEDLIHVGDQPVTLSGNELNNVIISDGADDTINGRAGDDTVAGGSGADSLDGGDGKDTATYAGAFGSVAASLLSGGGTLGEALGDTFQSIEKLIGSAFDDTLIGNNEANKIEGEASADLILGNAGRDGLFGGIGPDTLMGGAGRDRLFGGTQADELHGGSQADTVSGQAGADELFGDGGNDLVRGGSGDDSLFGGNGDDTLVGKSGADLLVGGRGADLLQGNRGKDTLTGAQDNDIFALMAGKGKDTITDFIVGEDRIGLIGELTFDDLSLDEGVRGALVRVTASGEVLAVLEGVDPSNLSEGDFLALI